MKKRYIVELSLLTRSTALIVVETSDGDPPNPGDMREAYSNYEEDDWREDPSFGEEGQHGMLGEIVDGKFLVNGESPGNVEIEKLPIIDLTRDDIVMESVKDLAEHIGARDGTEGSLAITVNKDTVCGAWLTVASDKSSVEIGSIVEGTDTQAGPFTLTFPFTDHEWDEAIDTIEVEVEEIWNATHGCELCGPEDVITGYRHVRENCPGCGGDGKIL